MVMTMVIIGLSERKAKGDMTTLATGLGPRTVTASEFKSKCLGLMDEVADTGEEIVITKRGNPVARLSAYRERPKTLYGKYRGQFKVYGDLDDSLDEDWEAEFDKKWEERLAID